MKVKEESEKVGLKLNIQKTKIMTSGLIISWQKDGDSRNSGWLYFSWLQHHCRCWLKPWIKRRLLLERKAVNHPRQFSSVAQSCPSLCDPMNRSTPGLPVHHQLLESTQTHVHRVGDAIQPSYPPSSPSPPAPNPSQHQGLFQWVSSSHQVAKVLEFQLQHQSFQCTPKTDLL